jgi:hypothetical protein
LAKFVWGEGEVWALWIEREEEEEEEEEEGKHNED